MTTMRERFTEDEWTLVRHVPADAFLMVAMSDGTMEDEEQAVFAQELTSAHLLMNPLHREVSEDLDMNRGGHLSEELQFQVAETAAEMVPRIARTKTLLKEKLTEDEYQGFVGSVFVTGLKVARSAGGQKGGIFRKETGPISDEEQKALVTFATAYEVDPQALQQYFHQN
jgi:hypothetical protein